MGLPAAISFLPSIREKVVLFHRFYQPPMSTSKTYFKGELQGFHVKSLKNPSMLSYSEFHRFSYLFDPIQDESSVPSVAVIARRFNQFAISQV